MDERETIGPRLSEARKIRVPSEKKKKRTFRVFRSQKLNWPRKEEGFSLSCINFHNGDNETTFNYVNKSQFR